MMAKNKAKGKKAEVKDFFVNPVANLGMGQDNKLSGTDYTKTRITQDYNLMVTLYRSHWIVKRIIDVVANDMTKAGIKITSEVEPKDLAKLQKCLKKRKVYSRMNEATRWARLFGGAGALMLIDGQDDILEEPLDLNSVLPGDFKGLLVFDRWSGILPSSEMVDDMDDIEFGLPKYYNVTTEDAKTMRVHHSRILRFVGRILPRWEKQVEIGWGASEIEAVIEEIMKRDNTSFNVAQLVFLANLRVLSMGDLGEQLSIGNQDQMNRIYNTLQAQNNLMSNSGLLIMSKDDSFDTKQYSFTGLAEVMEQFMHDVCGATGITATKLFGRSPAGMNSTGESDLQNYYEMIEENQDQMLTDNYTKLLPVVSMSELGFVPDDIDFEHERVAKSDEGEEADIVGKKMDAITKAFEANIITQKESREELSEVGKQYNMFSNIDATLTEKANNDLDFSFETPGFGGDLNNPEFPEASKPEEEPIEKPKKDIEE